MEESKLEDVFAGKEKQRQDLSEVEEMLRALGSRGMRKRPEMARKAMDALRLLKDERVTDQIEESVKLLKQGLLSLSMEKETRIGQSIDRVGNGLLSLQEMGGKPGDKPLEDAAAEARDLRQEAENFQQLLEALRQSGWPQDVPSQQGDPGNRSDQMQETLQRIRQYARGMLQPWAQGEHWFVNARSIHRKLTQKEIEDFLNQPELWKQLLEDVRELEATLRAQAEASRIKTRFFYTQEEAPPVTYRRLIEAYYRNLSETSEDIP
jgi:hypothetical protein